MSKNKRYTCNFKGIIDNQQNKRYGFKEEDIGIKKLCDLLNEQEERIKNLKETIKKRIGVLEQKIEKRNNEPFHPNPAFNNPMRREYDIEDRARVRTLEWVLSLFDGDKV